jgi:hypothetical protein
MITANSAIYIGIFTACVLDNCPTAVIHVERIASPVKPGYVIIGMRKAGEKGDAASAASKHEFYDEETRARSGADTSSAARIAGDQMGILLAGAG